ncbi:MAG: serine/threonine protein kinase, partial [Myxococcaceae bacterium]
TAKTGTGAATKKVTDPDKALDPDQVQVLDTRSSKTAKDSGVGWLTLYTVPPAAVFDGDDQLGTTPLTKIPFPVGVYKLRVIDPDGTDRILSAPIKAGEVTSMKLRVADLPAAK